MRGGWRFKFKVFDPKVSDFLYPRTGIVEKEQ
jgi:hypothetical protein